MGFIVARRVAGFDNTGAIESFDIIGYLELGENTPPGQRIKDGAAGCAVGGDAVGTGNTLRGDGSPGSDSQSSS